MQIVAGVLVSVVCVARERSSAHLGGAPRLALLVGHVAVAGGGARELGAAARAVRLGRGAGLLALMPQEVAEGGELPAVAAVVPALRLGSRSEHAHLVLYAG